MAKLYLLFSRMAELLKKDGIYQMIISAVDYDAEAYSNGEDTGSVIKGAYLEFMTGKTLTAPDRLCRY